LQDTEWCCLRVTINWVVFHINFVRCKETAVFCHLQDTEWFESKCSKRGGRGGSSSRPGTASSSRPATGSSSRGGRSYAPAAAAAGSQASPLPSFFALEELGDAEGDEIAAAKLRGRGGAAAFAAAVAVPDLEGFELEGPDEPEVRLCGILSKFIKFLIIVFYFYEITNRFS
jgi:hypothetical protein